jgi:hypothetical protein
MKQTKNSTKPEALGVAELANATGGLIAVCGGPVAAAIAAAVAAGSKG